jgi:hypothetical protein
MDMQQILNVLQASRFGMTAKEVAKEVGEPTAETAGVLFQMECTGQVEKRLVGRDAVWSIKTQPKPMPKKRVAKAVPATKEAPKPMPMPRSPLAGHLLLNLTEGPIRLGFSNLNDLQGFINKLNEGQ